MFAALNISAAVEKNVVSRTPTINQVTVIMPIGQADAAVLTLDQDDAKTMDMITIPLSQICCFDHADRRDHVLAEHGCSKSVCQFCRIR